MVRGLVVKSHFEIDGGFLHSMHVLDHDGVSNKFQKKCPQIKFMNYDDPLPTNTQHNATKIEENGVW